jgi:hypothetical protein
MKYQVVGYNGLGVLGELRLADDNRHAIPALVQFGDDHRIGDYEYTDEERKLARGDD